MLDRLAELVRERSESSHGKRFVACIACEFAEDCFGKCCPETTETDGSLMLARWAVLLVAQALEPQIDKWLEHIKGAQDGLKESYLLNDVAYKLLDLISETEATADGCKSEKQAGEVAE